MLPVADSIFLTVSEEESEEQQKMLMSKVRGNQDAGQDEGTDDDEAEYIAPAYDEIVPVINIIADKLMEANK